MWRSVVVGCVLTMGCGASSPSGSPDSGSPPSPSSYQTAEGFCAGSPKLGGGDLVGTWTVVAACAISTNAPGNCSDTTLTLSLDATGTVTFNDDMTGSIDATATVKKTSMVPLSCMAAGDCASLQAKLAIEVGNGAGASATCAVSTADASRCACVQTYSPTPFQGTGTYRFVLPNYLEGLGLQGGFDVQGRTLRLDGLTVLGTELDLIAQR